MPRRKPWNQTSTSTRCNVADPRSYNLSPTRAGPSHTTGLLLDCLMASDRLYPRTFLGYQPNNSIFFLSWNLSRAAVAGPACAPRSPVWRRWTGCNCRFIWKAAGRRANDAQLLVCARAFVSRPARYQKTSGSPASSTRDTATPISIAHKLSYSVLSRSRSPANHSPVAKQHCMDGPENACT